MILHGEIGILVGSLRKESFSRRVAENVAELFPEGYETEFIKIGNLPLYNQDFDEEGQVPEEITTFRSTLKSIEAVLFVTPEYNRSIPAVLKNAVEVGPQGIKRMEWQARGNY